MASGAPLDDAPPLPPPDFTPQSAAEFARTQQPPLRGLIIDPQYPPTPNEASKAFPRTRQPRPDFESERPQNLRRSSGATQILNTAPTAPRGEVINTIPGGDTLQPGKGRYNNASEDSIPGKETTPAIPPEPTLSNALKTLTPSDFLNLHQIPCARTALLQGMTAGFVLGGLLFTTGRSAWKASNWAVWSFLGTSVGGYSWCGVQRRREKEGMRAAVRIIEEKKEEKKARGEERRRRVEEAREAKRVAEEEERKVRGWWGTWGAREG